MREGSAHASAIVVSDWSLHDRGRRRDDDHRPKPCVRRTRRRRAVLRHRRTPLGRGGVLSHRSMVGSGQFGEQEKLAHPATLVTGGRNPLASDYFHIVKTTLAKRGFFIYTGGIHKSLGDASKYYDKP